MHSTRPILIISTGRTGTIFFSRLFRDLYPQVASYHERGLSRPIQILTNLHFAHLFPKSGLDAAWRLLKGKEIETCRKPFHLDANCFLYGLAALSPHLYPDLRVIHIVRDPRSYVTSHLNFARQNGSSFIANHLIPFWQPNPFLIGEISLARARDFTRFDRFCWIWDFKNRVMASLEGSQTPYLRLRFEDIFNTQQPEQAFGQMTDFIGLPRLTGIGDRFSDPANASSRTLFPEWQHWTSAQCTRLQLLCGERMSLFGYGQEAAWAEKLERASP
jgi:hypothetical protein